LANLMRSMSRNAERRQQAAKDLAETSQAVYHAYVERTIERLTS
jgi:hypothetical protein